jgi:hypothetical protein
MTYLSIFFFHIFHSIVSIFHSIISLFHSIVSIFHGIFYFSFHSRFSTYPLNSSNIVSLDNFKKVIVIIVIIIFKIGKFYIIICFQLFLIIGNFTDYPYKLFPHSIGIGVSGDLIGSSKSFPVKISKMIK